VQTADELAERLEIFFGAASETMCRVYARIDFPQPLDRAQLTGTLTGPTCLYSETLPATFSFVDRGPGESLLAEAVVPEPCFWTPEMPHLYRAEVQLRDGGKLLAQVECTFGIRPLGAGGGKLLYAGRVWVLRGVSSDELPPVELAAWHDGDTAMLVRDPDDALCEAASRVGVLVVADLATADAGAMRRLSRWPAVGVVAVPGSVAPELTQLGRNTILAQRFSAGEPVSPASWARAAICELAQTDCLPEGLAGCAVPLIAMRRADKLESVVAGRAACDRLQRDLAPFGQFAGYIV
jgi:hypothetical protein